MTRKSSLDYDPADRSDVATRASRHRAKASRSQIDLQTVARTAEGRRVLARLLEQTNLNATSFVPGDPCATAFQEGRRAMGLHLVSVLRDAGKDVLNAVQNEDFNPDD